MTSNARLLKDIGHLRRAIEDMKNMEPLSERAEWFKTVLIRMADVAEEHYALKKRLAESETDL